MKLDASVDMDILRADGGNVCLGIKYIVYTARSCLLACCFLRIVSITRSCQQPNHTYKIAILQHHELFSAHVLVSVLVVCRNAFAVYSALCID